MNTARIVVLVIALGAAEAAACPAISDSSFLPYTPFAQLVANKNHAPKPDERFAMARRDVPSSTTTDVNKGCQT